MRGAADRSRPPAGGRRRAPPAGRPGRSADVSSTRRCRRCHESGPGRRCSSAGTGDAGWKGSVTWGAWARRSSRWRWSALAVAVLAFGWPVLLVGAPLRGDTLVALVVVRLWEVVRRRLGAARAGPLGPGRRPARRPDERVLRGVGGAASSRRCRRSTCRPAGGCRELGGRRRTGGVPRPGRRPTRGPPTAPPVAGASPACRRAGDATPRQRACWVPCSIGILEAIVAMVLYSVGRAAAGGRGARRATRRRPVAVQPALPRAASGWTCWPGCAPCWRCSGCRCSRCRRCSAARSRSPRWSARGWLGARLPTASRVGVAACLVGLVLVAASAGEEHLPVQLAQRRPGPAGRGAAARGGRRWCCAPGTRAWPLALIAGMGFGGSALAIRAAHVQTGADLDLMALLGQPSTYLVIGYWTVGIISYTTALSRGDIGAVTAVYMVTQVLVPGHGRDRAARRPGARRAGCGCWWSAWPRRWPAPCCWPRRRRCAPPRVR